MPRLTRLFRRSRADRELLARAAVLHVIVAIVVRVLPFGLVRRALGHVGAFCGARPSNLENVDARVVQAVRTAAARLPGATCLTEALVTQCLLARYQHETTLCFGISRIRPDGRPFDAHAWLERRGDTVIGARGIAYDLLAPPSRCVSSLLLR